MVTLINCAILWTKAAVEAVCAEAEIQCLDLEPDREDVQRIANIYLNSGAHNHLWMIRHQL